MKKLITGISVLGMITILYTACRHEIPYPTNTPTGGGNSKPPEPISTCSPDSVYFANTILPILTSNCAKSGCHDAASHQEGLVLNSYNGIMRIVIPGNASASKLVSVITSTSSDNIMPRPPSLPLTSSQITAIKTWINQGALNNSCTSACDTSVYTYSAAVNVILTDYCVGCHSGTLASGGVNLSTYTGVKTVADNGQLMGAINQSAGFVPMPQGGSKLSSCQITQIQKWIDSGTPNN